MAKELTDTFLDQGKRRRMCDMLERNNKIEDQNVLAAMRSVPRHWFIDPTLRDTA